MSSNNKNEKAVTLLELLIVIVLLGIVGLSIAMSQRVGLDFIKSISSRVKLQNKAHLAMEEIVRVARQADDYSIPSNTRIELYENGSLIDSFEFGSGVLADFDASSSRFESKGPKRFLIHLVGKVGEEKTDVEWEKMILDTQVYLRAQ